MQPMQPTYGQPQAFGGYPSQGQFQQGGGGYPSQQFSGDMGGMSSGVDEFLNEPPLLEELGMFSASICIVLMCRY